jgi:hypothetical protein
MKTSLLPRKLTLVLALAALAVGAVPALAATSKAAKPSGTYTGTTKQGKPISFKVSKGKVKSVKFGNVQTCTPGGATFNDSTRLFGKGTISKKRKFAFGEGTDTATGAISGKFARNAKSATGSVEATSERTLPNTEQNVSCKTGKVTFTVHKK